MTVAYFNSGATLGVFFAPSKGAADTVGAGDWVDISAYVRGNIRINRGRSSERDTFQAGTCSLTLDNRDRRFDPEYAAGPYFGQLLPMRPLKVELTYSAVTYVLSRGYIQGWPQRWDEADTDAVTSIVAHDLFKVLAVAACADSRYVVEVAADTPSAWYRLGELADEDRCADSSGNARHGKYPDDSTLRGSQTSGLIEHSSDGAQAMTGLSDTSKQLIAADLHYLTGTAWSLDWWLRVPSDINTSPYNDVPMTIWAQSTGTPGWGVVTALTVEPILIAPSVRVRLVHDFTNTVSLWVRVADGTNTYEDRWNLYGIVDDGFRHHYAITRNGSALKLYVDGVERTRLSTSGTLTAGSTTFGTSVWCGNFHRGNWVIDEVAVYTSELSAARVLAHYNAGTTADAGVDVDSRIATTLTDAGLTWVPTSLEDSDVTVRGAAYDGQSVLGYLQKLEATEQGRLLVSGAGTLTFQARGHDPAATTIAAAFTDASGSTVAYVDAEHEYDDTRVVNTVAVSRAGGAVQRALDATSRTAYGLRPLTIDGLEGQSDIDCAAIADFRLAKDKDPYPRVRSLAVRPRQAPATLFPIVGAIEVGARVTFRRAPMGGTAFTRTLTVEGMEHSINVRGDWETRYLTAPADWATTVALWDTGNGWDQAKWGL